MRASKSVENMRRRRTLIEAPDGDLKCEEAILEEKARFGRTRNSLMKYLREIYGQEKADRAMWRVNRRLLHGYLVGSDRKEEELKATEPLSRIDPGHILVERTKEKERLEALEREKSEKERITKVKLDEEKAYLKKIQEPLPLR